MNGSSAQITIEPASFRDPSGFIFRRDGVVYRQVNCCYTKQYSRLMSDGLYQQLVERGDLLPHDERADEAPAADGAYIILRPRQLDFISYPYEWSFSQLKDAALLTLRIQIAALARGMTLKDASAYNVQFDRGRAVFIDTLSFDEYRPGEPWVAYGQFCRHFLSPLALMARRDVRLGQLLRVYPDGIPLDLASSLLPRRTRLSLGLGLHLHAHAASQRKHAVVNPSATKAKVANLSLQALNRLLESLISTIQSLDWKPGKTEWADYYQANNNYGQEGLANKDRAVRELINQAKPARVWDLGGNTGRFSRVAAESGASVVCWDIDPACVEANYRHVKANSETNVLPLLLDLTNPSPDLGWAHAERASFEHRGPADLVMALGLIHHLAISNNVPLKRIADFFSRICETLLIEFVPKQDEQVQKLLASRIDIFNGYTREGFELSFGGYFEIMRTIEIPGTSRTLYLMRKRRTG